MVEKKLTSCATFGGVARITPPGSSRPYYKVIPFRCGLSTCPICRRIKRARLIRRLKAAPWPRKVCLWTITTDPKVLDSHAALRTMSRRWHRVCRELLRLYPGIRYFRVIEFTKSGLPHMHVLFDRFVDWHKLRSWLVRNDFGNVLHFTIVPRDIAFSYLTKYVTKSLDARPYLRELKLRSWSASVHFLPVIKYFQEGTEYDIIFYGHLVWDIPDMMKMIQMAVHDGRSP
jgi:hypothetical protein